MEKIIEALKLACTQIANYMKVTKSDKLAKVTNNNNKSGDFIKELDEYTNTILKEELSKVDAVRMIGSEEEDVFVKTKFITGRYLVCFDPLDGSSNVDSNVTTGTIFAIYDMSRELKNGHSVVCAGYCLYGPATQFVVATDKVRMYQLINDCFEKTNDDLKIQRKGNTYSINEANKYYWVDNNISQFIHNLIGMGYSSRWVGSMVTDCHRTLIKGGIFAYPVNSKNKEGKIRLLYEAYPFAFIFKIAGGVSSNGVKNILDIDFPTNLHQKTGIFLGGPHEMSSPIFR